MNPVATQCTLLAIELRAKGTAYPRTYAEALDNAAKEIERLERLVAEHEAWQKRKLSPCIETEDTSE